LGPKQLCLLVLARGKEKRGEKARRKKGEEERGPWQFLSHCNGPSFLHAGKKRKKK